MDSRLENKQGVGGLSAISHLIHFPIVKAVLEVVESVVGGWILFSAAGKNFRVCKCVCGCRWASE